MPFSQNQIWQLRMTDIITLCHKSVTTVKKMKILNYQQERNTCTFASARDKLYHVSYVRTSLAVARLEANDSVYWTFTFFLATSYKNEISLPQSAVHTLSHEVLVKEIKQIRKKIALIICYAMLLSCYDSYLIGEPEQHDNKNLSCCIEFRNVTHKNYR